QRAMSYNNSVKLLWNALGEILRYGPYVAIAVALLLRRWDWALLLALATVPIALFGESQLKPIFHRPRPTADLVTIYQASKGLSFPSGTALNGMALVGSLLYLARLAGKSRISTTVIIVSVAYLLLGNLARVHVGAHWATDIIGGWLFASAWLALLLAGHQWWLGGQGRLDAQPYEESA
ncbi:MAG: phosphatase PAP2 family protein, partial [Blastocatellia bacterium]